MKPNERREIPGYPGYSISLNGKVYFEDIEIQRISNKYGTISCHLASPDFFKMNYKRFTICELMKMVNKDKRIRWDKEVNPECVYTVHKRGKDEAK